MGLGGGSWNSVEVIVEEAGGLQLLFPMRGEADYKAVAHGLGDLHVLIAQVGQPLQRRDAAVVIYAIGPAALDGEFLVEDLAAGTDGTLEQVAGFSVEGYGVRKKLKG